MEDDPLYHDGMRRLQDARETRRLADRLEQTIVHAKFSDEDRAFIQRCAMFFVATADAQGRPDCSYKGGLPGAGWDKETKNEVEGKRDGEKIGFTGKDEFKAELAGGKISITTAAGGPYTMEKTLRTSPTLGAKPPKGAVVLFGGGNADECALSPGLERPGDRRFARRIRRQGRCRRGGVR